LEDIVEYKLIMVIRFDETGSSTGTVWEVDDDTIAEITAKLGEPTGNALLPTMVPVPDDAIIVME
jgi:hypothetical protein